MADAPDGAPSASLLPVEIAAIGERLRPANVALAQRYPGDAGGRQPVHTYYAGAHVVAEGMARRLGDAALAALDEYAPDGAALAAAVGLRGDDALAATVHERVREKLRREPVEDLRIDFEDGYGTHSDAEEDGHAVAAARAVAGAGRGGSLPPFVGIRVKPLTEELHARSLRTLDLFVTALVAQAGRLPDGFQVTLPKVAVPEQVAAFADALEALEARLGIPPGTLRFDAMVETPQIVIDATGRIALPALLDAARGRLLGVSIGIYDYTASLGITAGEQRLRHPACDVARHLIQVSFAGTGLWLSDGSTTVLPDPPHALSAGAPLDERQRIANRAAVYRGWRMHYEDVRHSLAHAFYQGWDLHPAQLVSRYAAVYAFFLEGLRPAAERLRNFVARVSSAATTGGLFEEIATGQALLAFLLRGINSGAVTEAEAAAMSGLSVEEIRGRSFARVLRGRQRQ